jgi:hypothetical protein
MRQIIGAIGSLAVGLLMAAAGLYFDVATLTVAGAILFGLAAVLWLWEWGRQKHVTPQEVDASERDRKRNLIDTGRSFAANYTQGRAGHDTFRSYLESTKSYAALRGYLSNAFLTQLNNPNTVYAMPPGGSYEGPVEGFLNELDRLEGEWGLR